MSRLLFMLLATMAASQTQSTRISLTVVDPDGNPISAASVDYTGDHPQRLQETNAQGRYSFTTRSPVIVVRKPGYSSQRRFTATSAGEVRIVLDRLPARPLMPFCRNLRGKDTIGISGWVSWFRFQQVQGLVASPQTSDVDFGFRMYRRPGAVRGIRHGSGPMWSLGYPSFSLVHESVEFEEFSYELHDSSIIDARGRLADGTRWRTLAKISETVSYENASPGDAALFDRFLDGACFVP